MLGACYQSGCEPATMFLFLQVVMKVILGLVGAVWPLSHDPRRSLLCQSLIMAPPSPPKAVYVKSKVVVANGVEQTNPEERAIVASAQYRIRNTTASQSRLSFPIHLFVTLRRMLTKGEYVPALRVKPSIILPFLLLGNEYNAARYDELYALGVTHICNLDFASRNFFEGKFVYIKLNIVDNANAEILSQFDGVSQFFEGCEAVGGRVLVHCATGNSLSPAFVIAYLIAKKRKSYDEALQVVRGMRPTVQLYPSFVEQLKKYEV